MRKGSYSEELVKHEAGWIVNRRQVQDLSRAIHVVHKETVRRVAHSSTPRSLARFVWKRCDIEFCKCRFTRILEHCELKLQHQVVTDSRNAHYLRWYTVQKRQVLD